MFFLFCFFVISIVLLTIITLVQTSVHHGVSYSASHFGRDSALLVSQLQSLPRLCRSLQSIYISSDMTICLPMVLLVTPLSRVISHQLLAAVASHSQDYCPFSTRVCLVWAVSGQPSPVVVPLPSQEHGSGWGHGRAQCIKVVRKVHEVIRKWLKPSK